MVGTVKAAVISPAGPSFFRGLVFVLEYLVDSRSAGGHSWDIDPSLWPLLVFWLASGPTLFGCCGSVVNPT